MAGSSRYTVILDACVLYPAPVRDLLLSLAVAGLYHARWTHDIQREWVRSLLASRADLTEAQLATTCEQMNRAVPDSLVESHASIIPTLSLPDPDDRHVLAAAIIGRADAIVTYNLRDFPADALHPFGIEAQHPDDFVMNQLELSKISALSAVKAMRQRLSRPPRSAAELIATLESCQLPQTAAFLREAQALI
ncbi:MAG: PIN domain-containing protein [Betaproteobacteria bacterium]|nr:PIN domain-containing protein [Betaproteobacteria bacterium]